MERLIREFNLRQANKDSTNMPNRAVVYRALPEEESVYLDNAMSAGRTKMRIGHPYMGVNSWIRVMPEPGTEVVTMDRGDAVGDTMIGYLANSMIPRLKAARKGKQLIRVLNPGEIEIMSSGRAYLFLSDGGDIELRSGMIRTDMLQTEQELVSISPTYVRRLHLSDPSKPSYEERFGVVKRPDLKLPSAFQQYVRRQASGSSAKEFAFEYSRWLSDSSGKTLLSIQEGHVYDETGTEVKQASTNKPLRMLRTLSDRDGIANLVFQVDDDLNTYYDNASTATKEAKFNFGSLATLDVSADQYRLTINKSGTLRYGTSLTVTSPKVDIKSPLVNIGDNPVFPAILGDALVTNILTPIMSALNSFLALYGVDPALILVSPQTVSAASAAASVIASSSAGLANTLSQQVKMSG